MKKMKCNNCHIHLSLNILPIRKQNNYKDLHRAAMTDAAII